MEREGNELADLVGWQDFGPLRIVGARRGNMRPLEELYSIFLLGEVSRLLQISRRQTKSEALPTVVRCSLRLAGFSEWPYNKDTLPNSVKAADELIAELKPFFEGDKDLPINQSVIDVVVSRYREFLIHLKSELSVLPAFVVEDTRAYSPDILIKQPYKIFSKDAAQLLESLPTAQTDFAEGAKCLAFDRPTAVGFHALRAVEEVTRCYYAMITGRSHSGIDRNGDRFFRTLAAMVNELKNELPNLQNKVNVGHLPLILVLLEQLTELYRNPLDHPELPELKPDEGVDVFNHAINVISEIFREIRTRKYFAHTFGFRL